ncbi:Bis(5'nucleosyl)-tetraphosphatase, ApaH [Ferrimonas balearica DSM 9799]|uniref:bis(5'-nucleosyl)-tetraphosphatase (symmetrical) n=1 Tax=Ferrimonas balearica (strain DSM 9799 / CCM 4581 / KCTC 23876 / PAT) TaxID=550540 RepID=E1SLL1_FERBD|nr:symmetrical bis(5'-nucleosyl)-tetraphosphatase [Ferrimonas balearica]ADN77562.1 Bis(5'nucleosyl)-tetraphosphatase, ApaH [Ferrimonas balearica DSM 9799]MBW3141075.1 symmetrical bis(5'-nucleosyl)-tetraphosphatase [Ferrimonas balearica]MBW3165725.1 symmetrical bis(5'-nucleosyl)-tetraphosphatase [Ferrimonas balearica]MBY6107901.1 symmetrical bis(5'-nucleosyl)-tetraphosphatase [Ferrimonas balearica]
MANYFVGDIQGCYDELRRLLDKVHFDPSQDTLWACGDLIARGPDSLSVLRLMREMGPAGQTVLGNHDLHLLAVAAGIKKYKPRDRVDPLLAAPDLPELVDWLRQQPLLHELPQQKLLLTHAGLPPHWDLDTARARAKAVSKTLKGKRYLDFIGQMYGEKPDDDRDLDDEVQRQTYTVNALTRMRFLHLDGRLDFASKLGPDDERELVPWFRFPGHTLLQTHRLVFGHWAALMGRTQNANAIALDTGCCWGNHMTLWCLEDNQRHYQTALD